MRTVHRLSIHSAERCFPNANLKWAAGSPAMITVDPDIRHGAYYPAPLVHEIVHALKAKFPEMVITVY